MIKLNLKQTKEPFWIDFDVLGIRLKVRPLTTAFWSASQSYSIKRMEEIREEKDAPDLLDDSIREGLSEEFMLKGLARMAIVEWEGVFDESGETLLPVMPETIDLLMENWLVCQKFKVKYTNAFENLVLEGNASAPLPNGTSAKAEGADTADPAKT